MSTIPLFNAEQVATWDEARAIRESINNHPLFKNSNLQIMSESSGWTKHPLYDWLPMVKTKSGIYIPEWLSGPHSDPTPQIGISYWLHFRYNNGFEDSNVGLIRTKFKAYPTSPDHVFEYLWNEAMKGAK